jgi:CARDB
MKRTALALIVIAILAATGALASPHRAGAALYDTCSGPVVAITCPDLVVSSVQISSSGSALVTVKNNGLTSARGFYVYVSPRESCGFQEPAQNIWVPGLAAKASTTLDVKRSDKYRDVAVDSTRLVGELNESNNTAWIPVSPFLIC